MEVYVSPRVVWAGTGKLWLEKPKVTIWYLAKSDYLLEDYESYFLRFDSGTRLELMVRGTKTATCSALWEWQAAGDPLPEVGLKTIILNGRDEPVCIIETSAE